MSTTRLLVSSWDKYVYLYDTHSGEEGTNALIKKYEHRAPVLDVCFGENDDEAFSAGMDWQVKKYARAIWLNWVVGCNTNIYRIDLETGEQRVLSTHEAPVRSVAYSKEHCMFLIRFRSIC
jgi:cell cycle arrest protein BUB3